MTNNWESVIGLEIHVQLNSESKIINVDKIGYASDLKKIKHVQKKLGEEFKRRYELIKLNLKTKYALDPILNKYQPDLIFNLAAESHVDRSIQSPEDFITSNIIGTYNLIEIIRNYLRKNCMKYCGFLKMLSVF